MSLPPRVQLHVRVIYAREMTAPGDDATLRARARTTQQGGGLDNCEKPNILRADTESRQINR